MASQRKPRSGSAGTADGVQIFSYSNGWTAIPAHEEEEETRGEGGPWTQRNPASHLRDEANAVSDRVTPEG
jgi:hypothetical protein